jgi:hypothetical protein
MDREEEEQLKQYLEEQTMATTTNLPDGKQATVKDAIGRASAGDTLVIPGGSWTWTEGVIVDKALTIKGTSSPAPASPAKGPGNSSSIITRGWSDGNTGFFTLKPKSDVPVRVSGFKLVQPNGSTSNHAAVVIQGPQSGAPLKQIRIDNCYFDQGCQTVWWQGGAYGLCDHCHFKDIWICVIIYGGFTGDLGDGAWARKDYQAGSLNFPFTEDCTFSYAIKSNPGSPWVTYHDMGGRSVLRHCQIDGTGAPNGITGPVDCHGNQSIWKQGANNYRGTSRFEFYGNEVKLGGNIYQLMDLRGGSHLIHDNTFTTKDGSTPNIVDFRDEECDPNNTPGVPQRSSTQWPCEDQINASFIWNNTLNGQPNNKVGVGKFGNSNANNGDPFYIKEGRDYWTKAPDSTTKTSYPAPGAPSSSSYPAPYESLQLTSYTPAPYPHPLQGGEPLPPDPTPPDPTSATYEEWQRDLNSWIDAHPPYPDK